MQVVTTLAVSPTPSPRAASTGIAGRCLSPCQTTYDRFIGRFHPRQAKHAHMRKYKLDLCTSNWRDIVLLDILSTTYQD